MSKERICTVRVEIPAPLRLLTHTTADLTFELPTPVTQRSLIAAIEQKYPMLRGTLRDPQTDQRRAYIRFFADCEDISHGGLDQPLPAAVTTGDAAFLIVGAVSGGTI